MDDFGNLYLGKILKSWAEKRKAPEHVRERILRLAAITPVVKPRKLPPGGGSAELPAGEMGPFIA